VRALVDPGGQGAIFGAGDYHRGIADEGAFVIAVVGNLGFQGQEAPGLATVDAFLLQVIDFLGAEYLVGRARTIGAGNCTSGA
jgi:hypothetical protein